MFTFVLYRAYLSSEHDKDTAMLFFSSAAVCLAPSLHMLLFSWFQVCECVYEPLSQLSWSMLLRFLCSVPLSLSLSLSFLVPARKLGLAPLVDEKRKIKKLPKWRQSLGCVSTVSNHHRAPKIAFVIETTNPCYIVYTFVTTQQSNLKELEISMCVVGDLVRPYTAVKRTSRQAHTSSCQRWEVNATATESITPHVKPSTQSYHISRGGGIPTKTKYRARKATFDVLNNEGNESTCLDKR